MNKAFEESHEFGVVGLEVEEFGVEFGAVLREGLWQLLGRGVKKHLVETVQRHRFDR